MSLRCVGTTGNARLAHGDDDDVADVGPATPNIKEHSREPHMRRTDIKQLGQPTPEDKDP